MTTFTPTKLNGARPTILVATTCVDSASVAAFGVFTMERQFSSVSLPVTGNAERYSVVKFKCMLRIFRDGFNMVSLYILSVSALLASVIISSINGFSPNGYISLKLRPDSMCSVTTFPYRRCVASSPFYYAFVRAESCTMIYSIKGFPARVAMFNIWHSAISPTIFGAKFCSFFSICSYFKNAIAYFAFFYDSIAALRGSMQFGALAGACRLLSIKRIKIFTADNAFVGVFSSIFHILIITHHPLCANYVAVAIQRWVDVTGKEPILLDA